MLFAVLVPAHRAPAVSPPRLMQEYLRVRRAAALDDKRLAAIAYDTWSPAVSRAQLWAAGRPYFRAGSGVDVTNTLVAFTAQAVVGSISILPGGAGTEAWTIRAFAVDAFHQRTGVGTALLRAAAAATSAAGAPSLDTRVLASNHGAVSLFTRVGFVTVAGGDDDDPWHTAMRWAALPSSAAGRRARG